MSLATVSTFIYLAIALTLQFEVIKYQYTLLYYYIVDPMTMICYSNT